MRNAIIGGVLLTAGIVLLIGGKGYIGCLLCGYGAGVLLARVAG